MSEDIAHTLREIRATGAHGKALARLHGRFAAGRAVPPLAEAGAAVLAALLRGEYGLDTDPRARARCLGDVLDLLEHHPDALTGGQREHLFAAVRYLDNLWAGSDSLANLTAATLERLQALKRRRGGPLAPGLGQRVAAVTDLNGLAGLFRSAGPWVAGDRTWDPDDLTRLAHTVTQGGSLLALPAAWGLRRKVAKLRRDDAEWVTRQVAAAASFPELYQILAALGRVAGSRRAYTARVLVAVIDKVRTADDKWRARLTHGAGLRDKVTELLHTDPRYLTARIGKVNSFGELLAFLDSLDSLAGGTRDYPAALLKSQVEKVRLGRARLQSLTKACGLRRAVARLLAAATRPPGPGSHESPRETT